MDQDVIYMACRNSKAKAKVRAKRAADCCCCCLARREERRRRGADGARGALCVFLLLCGAARRGAATRGEATRGDTLGTSTM